MNKTQITKAIVKGYFFFAIGASATHLITAAHKGGLSGWEAYSVPFLIDGIAILGLIMRGSEFDTRTRSIGFRVQCGAGLLSLIGNVYAASNLGGAVFGVGIVALFILAEWLSDNMGSAKDEAKRASVAKAQATRKRNARQAKRVVKEAESLLK